MTETTGSGSLRPTKFRPTSEISRFSFQMPPWWQWVLFAIILSIVIVAWFLLTATAVRFESNAEGVNYDVSESIAIPSGPSLLIRPGYVTVKATAEGYQPLTQRVSVVSQTNQTIAIDLVPLPGKVTVDGLPTGTLVMQDNEVLGTTPFEIELPAGPITLALSAPRYQAGELTAEIVGRGQEQTLEYSLTPNWGLVTLPTTPTGANVEIDGEITPFTTPGPIEVLAGEHQISVKLPGYERWSDVLYISAQEEIDLPAVNLKLVGGTLAITTTPDNASISINGEYIGTSPLERDLRPNQPMRVQASLFGYQTATRNLTLKTGQQRRLHIEFQPLTSPLSVMTQPEGADVYVDNTLVGQSNAVFDLQAKQIAIRIEKEGFAGYTTNLDIQPDFPQELRVKLLTHDEARLQALQNVRTTSEGQELILLAPATLTLGASRRQPGRRSNEVFRTVELDRLIYLSKFEVTNAEFRRFASGHDSGNFENVTLNKETQPVVNLSWLEAAQYCNWLSDKEGFEPFYVIRPGDPVKYNSNSLGYRLPTEAEWAWVARHQGNDEELLLYPWGTEFEPPSNHGNYADRAAQHVIGRVIFNYNDNHTVSAPVGTFAANTKGLHDLGGNVAEWIHNFYEIPQTNSTVSNLGPDSGEYHVIRGSSWMHGTITDLRMTFRDYGIDGRRDVGFRLARFAE